MLPGIIGVVQATEAVKILLGIGDPLIGRLLTYDALGMRFREVKLRRDPKCPVCGEHPTIRDLSIHREGAAAAGSEGVQPAQSAVPGGAFVLRGSCAGGHGLWWRGRAHGHLAEGGRRVR